MTSLANQLKSLALPHTQALLGDEKKRVSLLFDPTEAANLDREAIFAIGKHVKLIRREESGNICVTLLKILIAPC